MNFSRKELSSFKKTPMIVVYKNGEFYAYSSYFMKPLFFHFINRVLNPYLKLKSEEEIDLFLDPSQEYIENTEFYKQRYEAFGDYYHRMGKHTRVIAFMRDPKEYKLEYNMVKEVAQANSPRDDFRLAFVTNAELVRKYKEKYGPKMFDQYSYNSLVLTTETGVYKYYDLEGNTDRLGDFTVAESLKPVETFNKETSAIIEFSERPVVYLYTGKDSDDIKAASKLALNALNRVAPHYRDRLLFMHVDDEVEVRKRV